MIAGHLWLFCWSFMCLNSCCYSLEVYVNESATNNDCSKTTDTNPCYNLTASLELVRDDTVVNIAPGSYSLLPSNKLTFLSLHDVAIIQNGKGTVNVKCSALNAGLSFVNSKNIKIQGIIFTGCGMVHSSTSRNFSVSPSLSLLNITTSLYFESCEAVSLLSVTVRDSQGIGVQFFATNGSNEILDSKFFNNWPIKLNSNKLVWGGGVYIEFPYCRPGNNLCENESSSSQIDILSVSSSTYKIYNCVFENNTARDFEEQRLILPFRSFHKTAGRGGGLSIFFKGNAANNTFQIRNCTFQDNQAVYGGGMYLQMQDSALNNVVQLMNLTFVNNEASIEGGGLLMSYLFLKTLIGDEVIGGKINLEDVEFISNIASTGNGGGVSYASTRQINSTVQNLNTMSLNNVSFFHNSASFGFAMYVGSYATEVNGILSTMQIIDSTFTNNSFHTVGKHAGSGAFLLHEIPVVLQGNIKFQNNSGTALVVYHSFINITESTFISFDNNTGHNGGAIALFASSTIIIYDNVHATFTGNRAYIRGGAIFADIPAPDVQTASQDCFIRYHNIATNPNDWNATFVFKDNQLGYDSTGSQSSIYASSLNPCLWGRSFGVIPSNNGKFIDDVFCWNNRNSTIWSYNDNSTTDACKSQIDTGLSSMSFPATSLHVIPGKVTDLKVTGFNEQNEPISSRFILHAYSITDGVKVDKAYEYISNTSIVLNHMNKSQTTASIMLETVGQEVNLEKEIVVTLDECPPGFELNNDGKCRCTHGFKGILTCTNSYSNFTSKLLGGYWIGKYKNQTVVAHCRYCDYSDVKDGYYRLPESWEDLPNSLCGDNRQGLLCSECDPGYAPAINFDNYKCVKCNTRSRILGILLFIGLNIIVPLVSLIILYALDVSLTNGWLHGPIFFAQTITTVVTLDADGIIQYNDIVKNFDHTFFEKFYITIYDFFNLEFFMFAQDVCLGYVGRYATIITIHYTAALVPTILVCFFAILYFCCDGTGGNDSRLRAYVKSKIRNIHNVYNILATCILLSYTKIAIITCYLLTPISLIPSNGKQTVYNHSVLYVDGHIVVPSKEYTPYLIVALIVAMVVLIPIPIFLLFCRYYKKDGFFNNLLYEFQKDFKRDELDWKNRGQNDDPDADDRDRDEDIQDIVTCSNNLDHIEYKCECCVPNYWHLCRYYLKESRCHFAVYTSCSFYDLRGFSGFFFFLRMLLIFPYLFAWTTVIRYTLQLGICMFGGIFIIIMKPYKRDGHNRVEALSLLNLAFIVALCVYQYHYTTTQHNSHSLWVYIIQMILVVAPFIWIVSVYGWLLTKRWCPRRQENSAIANELPQSLLNSNLNIQEGDNSFRLRHSNSQDRSGYHTIT